MSKATRLNIRWWQQPSTGPHIHGIVDRVETFIEVRDAWTRQIISSVYLPGPMNFKDAMLCAREWP